MHKKIGELAVAKQWITIEEKNDLLVKQQKMREQGYKIEETLFGMLLLEEGFVSKPMILELLNEQKSSIKPLFKKLALGGEPFHFGDYCVEKFIGRGAMGFVYQVKDKQDRILAMKLIDFDSLSDKKQKRFLREIAILSQLNHPNLISIIDYGQKNGIDFLVMPYLEGKTLDKVFSEISFSYIEWMEKFFFFLQGIVKMHQKKIIHRDIKPENIMLTPNNNLVLFDFGLGKIMEKSTNLTTIGTLGTPLYMAPEQTIATGKQDQRTDIWTLGVILYQILGKKLPFVEQDTKKLLEAIRNQQPTPLKTIDVSIPKQLEAICNRALQKNKEDRYQRVEDMATDIKDYLKQQATEVIQDYGKSVHQLNKQTTEEIHKNSQKIEKSKEKQMEKQGEFLPGMEIGPFKILEKLGEGGMGIVYLVQHEKKQKPFAMKIIRPDIEPDAEQIQRFIREGTCGAQIKHKNVVRHYTPGYTQAGLFYIPMEFVPGVTLREYIESRDRPLSLLAEKDVVLQFLQALEHLHKNDIIHRDIKPDNILIYIKKGKTYVKLTDFGLAKNYEEAGLSGITKSFEGIGTLTYMSPEQCNNARDVDFRADIYSAAATIYYLLSMSNIYKYENETELFFQILQGEIEPIQNIVDVPDRVAKAIMQCLQKDPEKRLQNISELKLVFMGT